MIQFFKQYFPLFLFMCNQLPAQEVRTDDYAWVHCCDVIENVSYGEDKDQRLDIYIQGDQVGEPAYFREDTISKPTLVFIHGGGMLYGRKEGFFNLGFFLHFLRRGWNAVNVEYRRGEGTAPQGADDIICALKWIVDSAEKYHIDTENIVLCGSSAGASLSLMAGLMNSASASHACYIGDMARVKAIISWSGSAEMALLHEYFVKNDKWNTMLMWAGSADKVAEISKQYSPIHYVTENAPPIISIHGESDSIIPLAQAEMLHDALEASNVKNRLITLPGGTHFGYNKEQIQFAYQQIMMFLYEVMK